MLRITIQESAQASTFKLEGKLTGPWVRELEQAWATSSATAPGRALIVDLADVTFIDCAGRSLLARMHESGATLIAHSPMNRSIVDEIARAGKAALMVLAIALALATGVRAQDRAQDTAPLRLTLRDAVQLALASESAGAGRQPERRPEPAGPDHSARRYPAASQFQAYEQTRRLAVAPLFGLQSIPFLPLPGHLGPYQVDQAGAAFSVPLSI